MSYNFSAEKRGSHDLKVLHKTLTRFGLIEVFPIEIKEGFLNFGISIPLRSMDHPRIEGELEELMTYLVVNQGFSVIDLFTGNPVLASNIAGLAKQVSS